VAVVIGSRQGPGRALSTTQGAEVKTNPEACDPQNPQNPQNPRARRRSAVRPPWRLCDSLDVHRRVLRRSHTGRAGRTLLVSELVPTDVVAFETRPS
jgi:hypothetical protein